jgi:hypothetical protein
MQKMKNSDYPLLACVPKSLPTDAVVEAARIAAEVNPLNRPTTKAMLDVLRGGGGRLDVLRGGGDRLDAWRIGVLTTKYWQIQGVKLTVGFLDNPTQALRKRILEHMNAWARSANVQFTESNVDPQVRIARGSGLQGGYWSYLGTDILSIVRNEPTMNLEAFTMDTPESEFCRVVRHETGHTLGFPHEHMRRALVNLIDRDKAIKHFGRTQGWSKAEVIAQVLTPIEESALWNPTDSDPNSIMCYQIPGPITKSGKPILGGTDIDELDYKYAGQIYPKAVSISGRFPRVTKFYSSLAPGATTEGEEGDK